MKLLLVNGSPHGKGRTHAALGAAAGVEAPQPPEYNATANLIR